MRAPRGVRSDNGTVVVVDVSIASVVNVGVVVVVVAALLVEVKIGESNPVVAIPAVPSPPSEGGNDDDDDAADEGLRLIIPLPPSADERPTIYSLSINSLPRGVGGTGKKKIFF